MNEVNINMKSVEVKTKTRKIRSSWTSEMVNDLNVYHNIDASAELERILGGEIKREMRKKKIEKILKHID